MLPTGNPSAADTGLAAAYGGTCRAPRRAPAPAIIASRTGLRRQAAEVGRCLRASLTESPLLPMEETVSVMETLDEIRRQIGLHYPAERAAAPS